MFKKYKFTKGDNFDYLKDLLKKNAHEEVMNLSCIMWKMT